MDFILQNILLIAVAAVSGIALLVLSYRQPGGGNALNATQATLLINRENAIVIDVRETDEYVAGHLPESRSVPVGSLDARIGEFDKYKDTPLILVCKSGVRSASALAKFRKQGYSKVHNLEGGIDAWRSAGLPLKKGAKK